MVAAARSKNSNSSADSARRYRTSSAPVSASWLLTAPYGAGNWPARKRRKPSSTAPMELTCSTRVYQVCSPLLPATDPMPTVVPVEPFRRDEASRPRAARPRGAHLVEPVGAEQVIGLRHNSTWPPRAIRSVRTPPQRSAATGRSETALTVIVDGVGRCRPTVAVGSRAGGGLTLRLLADRLVWPAMVLSPVAARGPSA